VLVSTDKAAQPRGVLGATKRAAELAALSIAQRDVRAIAVRFGNVLGSSGSVLEIMVERLEAGLPIPITHPDATRYFMSAPEATALVMKADLLGRGGEIYWLDMGEPIRIVDLARRLMALAGTPSAARRLTYIGLRPGEKLREDLASQGLDLRRTQHPLIWAARQPGVDPARVRRLLQALRHDVARMDALSGLVDLAAAAPGYEPHPETWAAAAAASMERSVSSHALLHLARPA
jgi:FlaA1/EpsC-like NDP-sugar epimerase